MVTRRELLAAAFASPLLHAQAADPDRRDRIFETVWQAVRDQFYDPGYRGVDWGAAHAEFLPKVQACGSDSQLLESLRAMLSRLRNSHIFCYSREEWNRRRNTLPFHFDHVAGRTFVRCVLRARDAAVSVAVAPGDEILSVDGVPAERLRPPTLARLDPILGNPNFGPAESTASIEIRRDGKRQMVQAVRLSRSSGFETMEVLHPGAEIVQIRLLALVARDVDADHRRSTWDELARARGLILDLRNCVGGSPQVSNFIAGSLLGGKRPLFRSVPRPGSAEKETLDETVADAPRFHGRAAVLINANTESQPELLAAICKEHGCARVLGERSAGAFNGFTVSVDVPGDFGVVAIPYTRSISSKGVEYEGRGVEPDEVIALTIEDCEKKRDPVLKAALRYALASDGASH